MFLWKWMGHGTMALVIKRARGVCYFCNKRFHDFEQRLKRVIRVCLERTRTGPTQFSAYPNFGKVLGKHIMKWQVIAWNDFVWKVFVRINEANYLKLNFSQPQSTNKLPSCWRKWLNRKGLKIKAVQNFFPLELIKSYQFITLIQICDNYHKQDILIPIIE